MLLLKHRKDRTMVTAVITTYKRNRAIVERAIKSVLKQTYKDYEIIVVDDSPLDFSRTSGVDKLIKELDNTRIYYYHDGGCKGACFARNVGLSHASGEFIGFLDDDDEWVETKIEKMLEVFGRNDEKLALVYCQFSYLDDDSGKEWIPYELFSNFSRGNVIKAIAIDNFIGSTSFPVLRTECLKNIGGFDIEMQSCQDYDVWFRLARCYSVDYVQEPLVRFHIHSNESIGKNVQKKLRGQERFYRKNIERMSENREAAYKRLTVMAPLYLKNHETRNAIRVLTKAISLKPLNVAGNMIVVAKTLRAGISHD